MAKVKESKIIHMPAPVTVPVQAPVQAPVSVAVVIAVLVVYCDTMKSKG